MNESKNQNNAAELAEIDDLVTTLTMKLENVITLKFGDQLDEDDRLVKLYRAIGRIYGVDF